MPHPMTIDIVSDVTCPWCAIGLRGLEEGLKRAGDAVAAEIRFHPYELNPDMPPEGENLVAHFAAQYGAPAEKTAEGRALLKAKAAELGFVMAMSEESRLWNTFDAHRLLHWAGLEGRQLALKHALFAAYFTREENLSDPEVLVRAAVDAELDGEEARAVIESDRYTTAVRHAERVWQERGVNAVPAYIFAGRYIVSGAQSPEGFEDLLRRIARGAA
ncbi:MAG TPA: DsbA family oxidoreductase [Sphingobium sp.]|nr:DsbA family oxidoreductase [Sphingobium sp.]